MIELLRPKAIEYKEFVIEQSPQAFVDWLRDYHNKPMHIALQHPVGVPASQELILNEPTLNADKVPLLIEFVHYKTVGFSEQVDKGEPQNNRSYPIQEPSLVIVFDLDRLLNGHAKIRAVCLSGDWLYYFRELVGAMRQTDKTDIPDLPQQGSKLASEAVQQMPTPNRDGATWDDFFDWYYRCGIVTYPDIKGLVDAIPFASGTINNNHSLYVRQHGKRPRA